jgi:hypothetical protein
MYSIFIDIDMNKFRVFKSILGIHDQKTKILVIKKTTK